MFKDLDPLLHSQLRLAIVSLLLSIDEANFVFIKEKTGATAGNLSMQIDKLNVANYINVNKYIDGKKPRTVCKITQTGIEAFDKYMKAQQSYIKK